MAAAAAAAAAAVPAASIVVVVLLVLPFKAGRDAGRPGANVMLAAAASGGTAEMGSWKLTTPLYGMWRSITSCSRLDLPAPGAPALVATTSSKTVAMVAEQLKNMPHARQLADRQCEAPSCACRGI